MILNQESSNTHQAMWLAIGSMSTFLLSIISAAILSRYFTKADYGTYRQILYVYNTLLIVFTAGLPKVFAYYLPRYSLEKSKDIVLKISKLLSLFGFFFSLSLYFGSGIIATILKNPELEIGLKYFSPIPLLMLPTLGIEGIFSTYKKTLIIAIYNTSSRLLMLTFIVLPVIFFKGTYLDAIIGWIIVSFITLIIALYLKKIPFKNINRERSNLTFKDILAFSLPILGASIAGIAIRSADQFYISRYFGTETFAEYANGFIQIPFVTMITTATSTVLMPQFSKMIHDKTNISQVSRLWKSALIKSSILTYPLVIFFLFHAKHIIITLYSEEYGDSIVFFQIAMLVNFFNIIAFAPLLFSLGETKYYNTIHFIGAMLAWLGGFILVKTIPKAEYIALLSISITIFIVFANLTRIMRLLQLNFWDLIPTKSLIRSILHSIFILAILVALRQLFWNYFTNNLSILVLDFLLYFILLSVTSNYFKVDFLGVILPLIRKKWR